MGSIPIRFRMTLFTIGFTRKSAEAFFTLLQRAGVTRVLDVRLNRSSQLSGFGKTPDLEYFLRAVAGIGYAHVPELAPSADMLAAYKRDGGAWADYAPKYLALIEGRRVEELPREPFDGGCLLCSEHEPGECHRRLAAEYLARHWGDVEIVHLT